MRRSLHHWLLIGTLTLAVGFHWPVLQGTAWVGMFLTRLTTQPVGMALRTTFNGRNPCRICRLVAGSREAGQNASDGWIELRQIEARSWADPVATLVPPSVAPLSLRPLPIPGALPHAPPVPPPRSSRS